MPTLTLPSDLKIIEEEAFYGDKSLDKVVLPDGVKAIGRNAFANSSIKSINLPSSITEIDDTAFDRTEGLVVTAIKPNFGYSWAVRHGYIQETSEEIEWTLIDGVLTVSGSGPMEAYTGITPWSKEDIIEIIIEEGVTSIRDFAFFDCSNLIKITIPESVTRIGRQAFFNCNSLTSITIPNSVAIIEHHS